MRPWSLSKANHRTHRKLLIVDGKIGFTGGVGIADEWNGNAEDPAHWRDNHYEIEGPIVADMQRAFFRNWKKQGRQIPDGDDARYYPQLKEAGNVEAEVIAGAPSDGKERIMDLFREAVKRAKKKIRIGTAYFMPCEKLMEDLIAARERGIDVELMLCGPHIDKRIVRRASRSHWGRLLEAGVEVFEYKPTLYHVKMLVIDDDWVSIGSANFDARSCALNDELNVNLHCSEAAGKHSANFDKDRESAREITLEGWKGRPVWQKLRDWFSQLFRDLM